MAIASPHIVIDFFFHPSLPLPPPLSRVSLNVFMVIDTDVPGTFCNRTNVLGLAAHVTRIRIDRHSRNAAIPPQHLAPRQQRRRKRGHHSEGRQAPRRGVPPNQHSDSTARVPALFSGAEMDHPGQIPCQQGHHHHRGAGHPGHHDFEFGAGHSDTS